MKSIALFITGIIFMMSQCAFAQMAVNTDGSNAETSAMLDVSSTSKGFLAPRMLASDRAGIVSPATGLLVYQTDAPAGYYFYSGSAWIQLSSSQLSQGKIYVGNASGVAAEQTLSGDVTLGETGITSIGTGKVTNDMLAGSISNDKLANPSQWTTTGSNIYYSSGNVGIGTSTLYSKLTVNSGTDLNMCVDVFQGMSSVFGMTDAGASNGMRLAGYPLVFSGDGANGAEAMRIIGNGYVGIGITDPGKKLTVNGYMGFVGSSDNRIYFGENDYLRFDDASGDGLKFIYDDVERLRLDNSGKLIVKGTYAQPQCLIGNDGSNGIFFEADGSSAHYNWKISQQNQMDAGLTFAASTATGGTTFASPVLSINQNGRVGIGTTSMGYTLHVNGSVAGTSAYNNLSDARLKKDVVTYENGIDKVMALRPVTFNWKQEDYPDMNLDSRNHVGFIAQEVEEVVPQVVSTAGDDMQTKSIAYSDLVPVLVKAIQEQQQQIIALQKQNEQLVQENNSFQQLKAEVEAIKKALQDQQFITKK